MATLRPIIPPRRLMPDVIIRDSSAVRLIASFRVRQDFVVVVTFGVAGDDVPGMEEAREVAEHAKQDVEEGVGGAEAGFYPY